MNKYLGIFKTSFKQETKTIANSIVAVVSFAVIIFIFKQLWEFIFGGSGVGNIIFGYSIEMMIWYMIMAEILLYAIKRRAIMLSFGNDIKSGSIAYKLVKPYNYFGYQIASHCASFLWKLCFLIPAGIVMGLILLGPIANFSFAFVFPIFVSVLLACLLTCIIYGLIGLFCFWIEESTPFSWILEKFVMLFGLFFPPEFFPAWLQPYINYSPIYAMMAGPSKLLANFSWELFLKVAISQVVYISICILFALIIFNLGKKKVNIHGG